MSCTLVVLVYRFIVVRRRHYFVKVVLSCNVAPECIQQVLRVYYSIALKKWGYTGLGLSVCNSVISSFWKSIISSLILFLLNIWRKPDIISPNCAYTLILTKSLPFADLFLFCYERDFVLSLTDNNQADYIKIRKNAKIRNRYNQVPHLTQDTTIESNKNTQNITYKRAKSLALSKQVPPSLQLTDIQIRQEEKNTKGSTKEAQPWDSQLFFFLFGVLN